VSLQILRDSCGEPLGDLQVRFRIQEGVQELAYQRFKRRALTPTDEGTLEKPSNVPFSLGFPSLLASGENRPAASAVSHTPPVSVAA
jgi:hypothetical protein